jgi:hypothetical protein
MPVRPHALIRSRLSRGPQPFLTTLGAILQDGSCSRADVVAKRYATCCCRSAPMYVEPLYERSTSPTDAEQCLAFGAGTLPLLIGASRRSEVDACLALSTAPLRYRGITGRWPAMYRVSRQTRRAHQGRHETWRGDATKSALFSAAVILHAQFIPTRKARQEQERRTE